MVRKEEECEAEGTRNWTNYTKWNETIPLLEGFKRRENSLQQQILGKFYDEYNKRENISLFLDALKNVGVVDNPTYNPKKRFKMALNPRVYTTIHSTRKQNKTNHTN